MSITSKEIEERVVAMRFDNDDFEKKTRQTMSTLDKLKASLDFRGVSKGFLDVSNSSSVLNKNIQVLGSGVESIRREFSALEVVGATCLVNLTNSAIKAGKTIVDSLALEPVRTGFSEYETKIGSIQTILTNTASKGTTIQDVTKALDTLNTYADKTIYNFTEMTKNIGRFTAAGIDLNIATDAIQGISNLAAASGSTSQQASTAMYQLSQALGTGALKLQDWNSVVNAGMGGTLFQEALKETAVELGRGDIMNAAIEKFGSFRESLREGWIDAEVLTTTLNKFTTQGAKAYGEQMKKNGVYTEEQNKKLQEQALMMENAATEVKTFTALWDTLKETAQSGWTQTWELIVGDYEDAKNLFTKINNVISPMIDKMSQARNDFVEKVLGSPSKWNDIVGKFSKAGIGIESINKAMAKTYMDKGIIKDMSEFEALLQKYGGDYTKMVKGIKEEGLDTFEFINLTRESLKQAIRDNSNYTESQMTATQKLKHFQKVVTDVWQGDYGNQGWNQERQKALEAEGYEYERVQRLVNLVKDAKDGYALTEADLTEEDLRSVGLTKQQIKAFLELKNQIKDTDSELNDWIDTMYKADGRELLFGSIFNIGKAIKSVFDPIKKAFDEVFGGVSYEKVYNLLEAFNKFTESLILNEKKSENLKNTFIALFNILDSIRLVLGSAFRLVISIISRLFSNLSVDAGDLFKSLADGTTSIREFLKENDAVALIMSKIGPAIDAVGEGIKKLRTIISESEVFGKIKDFFADKFSDLSPTGIITSLGGIFSTVKDFILEKFFNLPSLFTQGITRSMNDVNQSEVSKSVETGSKNLFKGVKSGLTNALGVKMKKDSNDPKESDNLALNILSAIRNTLGKTMLKVVSGIKRVFIWINENIGFGNLVAIASTLALFKVVKQITDTVYIFAKPMESLAGLFDSVSGLVDAGKDFVNQKVVEVMVNNFVKVCGAILILALAIAKLSTLNVVGVAVASGVIVVLIGMISHIINGMKKTFKPDNAAAILAGASTIIGVAALLVAMTHSLLKLCDLGPEQLVTGVIALGALMALISAFLVVVDKLYSMEDQGINVATLGAVMIGVGLAVQRLIAAVETAGSMSRGTLKRGLGTVAGLMTFMGIVTALLALGKKGSWSGAGGAGVAALGISIGVAILIAMVEKAAKIPRKEADDAMYLMRALLTMVTIFSLISSVGRGGSSGISLLAWAGAMLLIPPIVKTMSKLSKDEVDNAATIIEKIIGIFSLLTFMSLFSGKYSLRASGLLTTATLMMAVMIPMIYILGNIHKQKLDKAVHAMMILMGMMAVITGASGIHFGDGQNNAQKAIVATGLMVSLLGGVAAAISLVPAEQLIVGVGSIIGMLFAISLVLSAASMIVKDKEGKSSDMVSILITLFGMFALIGEVATVVGVISTIANALDSTDALISSAVAMATILIAISTVFVVIAKNIPKDAKENNFRAVWNAVGVIAVLGAMAALMMAGIKKFSDSLNTDGLSRFGVSGDSSNALQSIVDSDIIRVTIAAALISIVLTALAIWIIQVAEKLDAEHIKETLGNSAALALVVVGLGVLLLGVGLAIKALQSDIMSINTPDKDFIEKVALMLGVLAALVFISTKVAEAAGESEASAGQYAGILITMTVLGGLLLGIGGIFKLLNVMKVESVDMKVIGGMILSLFAIALVAGVLSYFAGKSELEWSKDSAAKLIGEGGMLMAVALVAAFMTQTVMPDLAGIPTSDGIISKAVALACVLVACGAVAGILVAISSHLLLITKGDYASFAVGLLGEGGMLVVVAKVAEFVAKDVLPKLNEVNADGILTKVAGLSAVLISLAIVGVIISWMASIIATVVAANPFAAIIGFLGAAGLGMLLDWFIENKSDAALETATKFGNAFKPFGEGLKAFCDILKETDTSGANKVTKIIEILGSLNSKELQQITTDLDEGTLDIVKLFGLLSTAIATLVANTEDLDLDKKKIDYLVSCISPIIDLTKQLPRTDGDLQKLIGTKDLLDFVMSLTSVAVNTAAAMEAIKGKEELFKWGAESGAVNNFCACLSPIIEVSKLLERTGGMVQDVTGVKSLRTFVYNLVDHGEQHPGVVRNMREFLADLGVGTAGSNIWFGAPKVVEEFAASIKALATAAQEIENTGGVVAFFVGDNTLDVFASQVATAGTWFSQFNDTMKSTQWDNSAIDTFTEYFKHLQEFMDNYPSDEVISKMYGIEQAIVADYQDEDGSKIAIVGKWLSSFANSISDINHYKLANSITDLGSLINTLGNTSLLNFSSVDGFTNSLQNLGGDALNSFIDNFEGSYADCAQGITTFMGNIEEAYRFNGKYRMTLFGKHIVEDIVSSINDKLGSVTKAATDICTSMYNVFADYHNHLYNIGVFLTNGFIEGINARKDAVKQAVDELTNIIGPRMADNLEEQSPSKMTFRIGSYVGEGLANGMISSLSMVQNASDTMSEESVTAINNALSNMYNAFDQDTFNPTITPVLDLSNVQNGFSSINSLLDGYTVNARTQLSGGIYTNASTDDVISSISALGDILGVPTGNTYNINGITYDDGSNVASAVSQLIYAANIARRS